MPFSYFGDRSRPRVSSGVHEEQLVGDNGKPTRCSLSGPESKKQVSLETKQSATSVAMAANFENQPEEMTQASGIPFEGKEVYDFSSSPEFVRNWVKEVLIAGPCNDENAVIAECCRGDCRGFGDRIRGLGQLVEFAHQTGRKLCLSRNYFLIAPGPTCAAAKYIFFYETGVAVWQDPSTSENHTRHKSVEDRNFTGPLFESVKYLTSPVPLVLERKGLPEEDKEKNNFGTAKQLGMLILFLSGAIDDEMTLARRAVLATVRLYSETNSFIALHVRVGGSPFTLSSGQALNVTSKWDQELQVPVVENLLRSVRKLSPDLVCKKPLYIATDSSLLKGEIMAALPEGLNTMSCCTFARHMGVARAPSQNIQHLIDIQAFGLSEKVFCTGGGYARAGLFAKQWQPVPSVSLSRYSTNENEASLYLQELTKALECS